MEEGKEEEEDVCGQRMGNGLNGEHGGGRGRVTATTHQAACWQHTIEAPFLDSVAHSSD